MPQNVFTANTLFIQRKCGSLLACHVLWCICEIHYTTHMTEQHKKNAREKRTQINNNSNNKVDLNDTCSKTLHSSCSFSCVCIAMRDRNYLLRLGQRQGKERKNPLKRTVVEHVCAYRRCIRHALNYLAP